MASSNNGEVSARLIGTLPVDNVQALAATLSATDHIPTRYIRPEAESEAVIIHGAATDDIPLIDFHKLLDPNLSDAESSKLHHACQNWGFFQVPIATLHNETKQPFLAHFYFEVWHFIKRAVDKP